MEWLLVVILAAAGAGFLAIPFFRPKAGGANAEAQSESPRAPDSERTAPATAAAAAQPAGGGHPRDRLTAVAVTLVMVAGASALYVYTSPDSPQSPQSSLALPSSADSGAQQPKLPDVDTMIQRVVDRLKTHPENKEDWRMLGWSYFETQHYPEAVDAYAHAVALDPQSADFQSAYGEAQVLAAGGKITPDATKAFKIALGGAPNDERALHYVGLAKKEGGDAKGAIADWLKALKNAKPESLWAPRLRAEIADTAKAAKIDVAAELPPAPVLSPEAFAAAPQQQIQQAQAMSPEEQQAMVRNMVAGLDARLAQNPRDREGWIRLIRSRKVLNESEAAETALDRALTAFKDDPTTQTELKAAALELGVSSKQ